MLGGKVNYIVDFLILNYQKPHLMTVYNRYKSTGNQMLNECCLHLTETVYEFKFIVQIIKIEKADYCKTSHVLRMV